MMKKSRIQYRIIAASLISSLFLGMGMGVIAITNSRSSLIEARKEQLSSIREGAKEHIQNYMRLMGDLLVSLASDKSIKNALFEYRESFYRIAEDVDISEDEIDARLKQFYETQYLNKVNYQVPGGAKRRNVNAYLPGSIDGKIAQYLFIAQNPFPAGERDLLYSPEKYQFSYAEVHHAYHETLNRFLHNFNLYDVFIVDQNGFILYTDFKELDYATNLVSGPYKDTGLARSFKAALTAEQGTIVFEDFSPYEPSYNLPAAFIGTPIFIDGKTEGVFLIQIPIDKINEIMTFNQNYAEAGLGNTGESYLVGNDYAMRSDSRFIQNNENPLIQTLGTTIGIQKIESISAREALSGNNGVALIDNYRHREVISAFAPVKIFDKTWAVIAEIDTTEALEKTRRLTIEIFWMSLLIIAFTTLLFVYFNHRIFVEPLTNIIDKTKTLSEQKGDLTQKIEIYSLDEIGELAMYFNEFIEALKEQLIKINQSFDIVNEAVHDLSVLSREIESTSNNQAISTREIVSTMEEYERVSKDIASRISDVAGTADRTRSFVEEGFSLTQNNKEKMDEIKASNEKVIEGVEYLNEQMKNVWGIVNMINSITDQTKMIAFNAQLEASAAGDVGKNFKIVANEIRRLADNTTTSTKKIESNIVEIQRASDDLITVSHDSTAKIHQGWELSAKMENIFNQISESSTISTSSAAQIAQSIHQQAKSHEQILIALKQMSSGIENFVISTKSIANSSEALKSMAENLYEIVKSYRV